MIVGLLIAQAWVTATVPATYEIGLRTEARGATAGARDLQLNPVLSLTTPIRSLTVTATYIPRILALEPASRGGVTVLHRGAFLGEWHTHRNGRLFLEQQLAYGTNAFSLLVVAAEGGTLLFDRLAELPPVLYFGESTNLGIEQPLSRKLRLTASAGYAISGGADDAARRSVPLQRGPRSGLTLAWLVRPRDTVSAAVRYLGSYFSTGARAYLLEANAAWRHRFSRDELELGLGAAGVRDVAADRPDRIYARPIVTAGLTRQPTRRRFHRLGGYLRARLAPAIDPLTGFTYSRADGLAALDYLPIPRLKLGASGGAAVALSGSLRGQVVGLAGLAASYEFDRHFTVTGGARLASQSTIQWVGFVAVSLSYREPL